MQERAVVAALLDQLAAATGGGALLVVGEPGMGKTTLLAALQHDARGRGYLVRSTGCIPMSTPLPLEPVIELLLSGDDTQPRDFPALAGRERYADALRGLRARGSAGPSVLVLDDLQWSDHATLAFLHAAVAREEPGGVLWVLATRPGTTATMMADALHRLPHATTLPIAGLDIAELADPRDEPGGPAW